MSGLSYRPAIDGLRAIAVMLVVLFHSGMPGLQNGYVGVDIFFAISGYLITSILLRERMSTGRLSFRSFYARRVRRLLPASLLVLAVTAVAYRLTAPPIDILDNRAGFGYSSVYVANWYFLARSQDYFTAGAAPSPVLHFWSLGVEEQFYLVWPMALMAILAIAVIRERWIAAVLTALTAVALLVSRQMDAIDATAAYFNTGARAYQLLAGACLAAWLLRRSPDDRRAPLHPSAGTFLVVAAALMLLAAIAGGERLSPWAVGLAGVVAALAFLAGLELKPAPLVMVPMQSATAVRLGRWSYSTYLWHWPVLVIGAMLTPALTPQAPWLGRVTTAVTVSLVLAWATFRWVEQPGHRISMATAARSYRLIGIGLLASVACAGVVLALLQVPASAQRLAEVVAQGQGDQEDGVASFDIAIAPSAQPTSGGLVPEAPREQSARPLHRGSPDTSVQGSARHEAADELSDRPSTVMLIGDSHAEMWRDGFMAAARRLGFTGIVITESGCPWMDIPALSDRTGELHGCQEALWKPALEAARTYHPDVVILASRSVLSRRLVKDGEIIKAQDPGWETLVADGVNASLPQIARLSGSVALLEPYPMTSKPMVSCLSTGAKPSDCDLPATSLPGTAFVEALYRRQPDRLPNVHSVSLDEIICPGGTCPALATGVVTFADDNHLTVDYASRLVPALLDELDRAGMSVRGKGGRPVAKAAGS